MPLAPSALALLLAAAPAAPPPPAAPAATSSQVAPVLHGSVGTGACATPRSDLTRVDNPCWLQLGLAPAIRLGGLELGLVYEGRDPIKLVSFLQLRPPAVTVVGASAGAVFEPGQRWRLLAAGELGWRRYMDFAGSAVNDREGAADTLYAGVTGRAGFGLRPQTGRTDRLEVSLSLRRDLTTGRATVEGVPWEVAGWSVVMGIGLVGEW
ncbi:MAG: hypothetical protein IPO09_16185 [Anaeromyxobacter sp.]|nr:hypothetical protein [Anaeromyxobacter sp.]MBL0276102.1 hypothetical protein [Anaeromyxobacter sp.]